MSFMELNGNEYKLIHLSMSAAASVANRKSASNPIADIWKTEFLRTTDVRHVPSWTDTTEEV